MIGAQTMAAFQGNSGARFPETRWSLVRSAARGSDHALQQLCESYAPPVYAFFRRAGHDAERAADLTQGFFASKILDPERRESVLRGEDRLSVKFRSFLRVCLKNFAHATWERETAQKRGGAETFVSFDVAAAERSLTSSRDEDPGKAFDLSWASCVVDRVFRRLQEEIEDDAKLVLQRTLQAERDKEIAAALGITPNAVAKIRKRTLDRARAMLRGELRETVARPQDLQDELAELTRIYALPSWLGSDA